VIGDGWRSALLRSAGGIGAAVLLVTACSSSGHAGHSGQAGRSASPARASVSASPSASPTPSPSRRALEPLPVAPGQGTLAQTRARPPDHGRAFHAMVTDLWLAVRRDKPSLAKAAFFPETAYKQVKAISDPAADWRTRLWDDFALDVKAAHRLLGRHPEQARLIKVIVDESGAAWIDPGVCYNRIGYWHVANPRVVYRLHGQERSFGIASLISWRGIWYVVHFGGVVRPAVGMVDAPAAGAGYPGPQGGC
jgi:hypothetical protein